MWLNPLPSETVIGAIIGAILSTIMAYYKYFEIQTWGESFIPLFFVFMILTYGVSLHFYCALNYMNRKRQGRFFLSTCAIILVTFIFLRPKEFHITSISDYGFDPNAGNILMVGVLIIWMALMRTLTYTKQKFNMES